MTDRYYHVKSPVLLTGAGFSRPFGGYLASEMWSLIFNQLASSDSQRLRQSLLGEPNYERAYDRVMSGEFTPAERTAFTKALAAAYGELDRSIFARVRNNYRHVQWIRTFIDRFTGEGNERGFMFTLNQDILVEKFYSLDRGICQIPALGHPDWFSDRWEANPFPETDISNPPQLEFFRKNFWAKDSGLEKFLYIKLHGSYLWKSAQRDIAMAIGDDKSGTIADEPLLKWYHQLFSEVLKAPKIKLLVIGYGFMDAHINNVIADAERTGLELYVVNTMQPKDFRDHLFSVSHMVGHVSTQRGKEIWGMLRGYHCGSLEQLKSESLSEIAFFKHLGI